MKTEHVRALTEQEAWKKAKEIFGCGYEKDEQGSRNAGYPVYRGTSGAKCWISDLGSRLELNMANGDTINIWIEDERYTAAQVREIVATNRKEVEAADRILKLLDAMEDGETTKVVLAVTRMRRAMAEHQLAKFGVQA